MQISFSNCPSFCWKFFSIKTAKKYIRMSFWHSQMQERLEKHFCNCISWCTFWSILNWSIKYLYLGCLEVEDIGPVLEKQKEMSLFFRRIYKIQGQYWPIEIIHLGHYSTRANYSQYFLPVMVHHAKLQTWTNNWLKKGN